jgi:hypothetical protein
VNLEPAQVNFGKSKMTRGSGRLSCRSRRVNCGFGDVNSGYSAHHTRPRSPHPASAPLALAGRRRTSRPLLNKSSRIAFYYQMSSLGDGGYAPA